MIIPTATAPAASELATLHDDDTPALRVRSRGSMTEITRADGSELSALEQLHVRAAIAAQEETP